MPAHKLRPQKLQCPFCPAISTRGTGLSAHVRARHPREYRKWNKNPNRLLEAAAPAPSQPEPGKNRRLHPVRSPMPVNPEAAPTPMQPVQEQPILLAAHAPQPGDNDLAVFPVVGKQVSIADNLLTLDEGLRSGQVVVTESGGAGGLDRRRPGVTTPPPSRRP